LGVFGLNGCSRAAAAEVCTALLAVAGSALATSLLALPLGLTCLIAVQPLIELVHQVTQRQISHQFDQTHEYLQCNSINALSVNPMPEFGSGQNL
jgi:hypothetical protein